MMISLRSVPKRYCRQLQCYLKSKSKLFCTNTDSNSSHETENKWNNDETKTQHSEQETSTNYSNSSWVEAPTLPCFLSQFDAMETFNIWAKRQWFAPPSFRKDTEKYVHVIHKYYVPYWHFEATAQSRYHASTSPDAQPSKEAVTSCSYSSSSPEMQIIASDRLTSDESKFLSIPLGPTQFQRMTHHIEDLLPDTVNEVEATKMVTKWLQSTETHRVHQFVTVHERLHKPYIQSLVEHSCRKAYMPCFIIYFNPNIANPKDKPDVITDTISSDASYRCIVHGYNGNIQGPKLYSFIPCTFKLTLPLSVITIFPIGTLLWYPFINLSVLSIMSGLFGASVMQSPLFKERVYRLEGHTLDTQQTRLKRQQMEEKEVEDILREAEKSWGSHTHRSRPIPREQERSSKESYERYEQTTKYYKQKIERGYDSEGRPIGRRPIRFIELYEILGISPNASTREVQQAFTKLAKQYHPDQLQQKSSKDRQIGEDKFQKVLLAFQVLKDPERRRKYDMTGSIKEEKKRNKGNGANTTSNDKQ